MNGDKPWPKGLLEEAQRYVAEQEEPPHRPPARPSPARREDIQASDTLLDEALGLLAQGWSVVPQLPGAKKPSVRWKPFQERLPTREELAGWFEKWPRAGLALVLGPVSDVFAIDVDGPEAHAALLERLGCVPRAPKAISGSGKPYRYHLYFCHPDLTTKAKQTPWHPQLEFRGHGGIVVIPPHSTSRATGTRGHRTGRRTT